MLPPFSMEITLVWSSSLIQTRNVLSLLCLVERKMNSFKAQGRPWKITLSILSFITVFQDCEEVKHCKITLLCAIKDAVKLLSHLDPPYQWNYAGFSSHSEKSSFLWSHHAALKMSYEERLQTLTQLGWQLLRKQVKGEVKFCIFSHWGWLLLFSENCAVRKKTEGTPIWP